MKKWTVIHLAARAHYLIPVALKKQNAFRQLLTDVWVPPGRMSSFLKQRVPLAFLKKFVERYHAALQGERVWSFSFSLLLFEIKHRFIDKQTGWELILARNYWWERKIRRTLPRLKLSKDKDVIFSFAYTGYEAFKYASENDIPSVTFQMDPGIEEERMVQQELEQHPELATTWEPAPSIYWERWRKECEWVTHIFVNSEWSKRALIKAHVAPDKIHVIPLPFDPPKEAAHFLRDYPERFTAERPMKVLFLGTLTLRKGLFYAVEACKAMSELPVQFYFVGSQETEKPAGLPENTVWLPPVSREETAEFYKEADVFLFPTVSDGFGLTQLEAFAWQLPIIASRQCGDVVEHDKNGLIMKEISVKEVVNILKSVMNEPERLHRFAKQTTPRLEDFTVEKFGEKLASIAET